MSKKIYIIIIAFVFASIFTICFLFFKNEGDMDDNGAIIYDYYLSDNSNHLFDHYLQNIPIPHGNSAKPFSIEMNQLSDIAEIKKVLPYYQLSIGEIGFPSTVEMTQGNSQMILEIPFEDSSSLGNTLPVNISAIQVVAYADENIFKNKILIDHSYQNNSGIYITEDVCQSLKIKKNGEVPKIITDILLPIKANYSKYNYLAVEQYSIIDYQKAKVEFEIEGVISEFDDFYGNTDVQYIIFIPYDLSKEIYSNIDLSDVELNDGEELWKPNTYIVQLNEQMTVNELGIKLQDYLPEFFLVEHNYDKVSEWFDERKIYD